MTQDVRARYLSGLNLTDNAHEQISRFAFTRLKLFLSPRTHGISGKRVFLRHWGKYFPRILFCVCFPGRAGFIHARAVFVYPKFRHNRKIQRLLSSKVKDIFFTVSGQENPARTPSDPDKSLQHDL